MLVLKARRQKLDRIAFDPTGRRLAAGGEYGAAWWDLAAAGGRPRQFGGTGVWGLGFDHSGDCLIASTTMEGVRGLHLPTGAVHPWPVPDSGAGLTPSPTGPFVLVSVSRREGAKLTGCRVGPTGAAEVAWVKEFAVMRSEPAFAPDGAWFAQFEFRGWGRLDDPHWLVFARPDTGDPIRAVRTPDFAWTRPVVSADGRLIAYTLGEQFWVRSAQGDATVVGRVSNDSVKHFTGVAFHPSGRYLAATSNDATVKLYDAASWQLAKTFTWEAGRMRSVAFSPDGTLAAAASDTGRVVVWDVDL